MSLTKISFGLPLFLLVVERTPSLLLTVTCSGLLYTYKTILSGFISIHLQLVLLYIISNIFILSHIFSCFNIHLLKHPHLGNSYFIDILFFHFPKLRTIHSWSIASQKQLPLNLIYIPQTHSQLLFYFKHHPQYPLP